MIKNRQQLQVDESLTCLNAAVVAFATQRPPSALLGQFLDSEGCLDGHFGIYGMAGWLIMTQRVDGVSVVQDLRLACERQLKDWVRASTATPPATAPLEKHSHELSSIVAKIAFAFEALALFTDAHSETATLQNRLTAAQNSDGSWGFLASPANGNPVLTALVLRSVESHPAFADRRRTATAYLLGSYESGMSRPLLNLRTE